MIDRPDIDTSRKQALMTLIKLRRQIEDAIVALSGDPVHREFVAKFSQGFNVDVRETRYYDVEPFTPEEIQAIYGVELDDDSGDAPAWFTQPHPAATIPDS